MSAHNTAKTQRIRLLAALRDRALTTLDARKQLDILHPAMRVLELREQGFDIKTVWTQQATEAGAMHRIAQYVLCSTVGGVL